MFIYSIKTIIKENSNDSELNTTKLKKGRERFTGKILRRGNLKRPAINVEFVINLIQKVSL